VEVKATFYDTGLSTFRAVPKWMYSIVHRAKWLFLEEKATQEACFRSIAIGEPLYWGEPLWARLRLRTNNSAR
jgi:hypothetical protein